MIAAPRAAALVFSLALCLMAPQRSASGHPAHATPVNHPFVAAFERFYSAGDDPDYLAEGGLLLLNELNCVACHAPPPRLERQLAGRPATSLAGAGSRLGPLDLELFLRNPRFVKQDTLMPSLFAGPDRDLGEVEALKHYLGSLREEPPPLAPGGSAVQGQRLYHRLGCVACHAPEAGYVPEDALDDGEAGAGLPSVPMNLADRYEEAALAAFLQDPAALRPAGRMADFQLTPEEAAHLAAYLKAGPVPEIPGELQAAFAAASRLELDDTLVEEGRRLFVSKNCIACHQPPPGMAAAPPALAQPLDALKVTGQERLGCLADRPQGEAVPAFFLGETQKTAIELALSRLDRFGELDLSRRLDWTLATLNCYACHERGGKGGPEIAREPYFGTRDPASLALGRWGRLPPPLDGAGDKLTRAALEEVLRGGSRAGGTRPHLESRMPCYPESWVQSLRDDLLAAEADSAAGAGQEMAPGSAAAGREWFGLDGSGCALCHGLKGRRPVDTPAADLSRAVERFQPGWWQAFLADPLAPPHADIVPESLPGPPVSVEEAADLWAYLRDIAGQGLPEGLRRREEGELRPEVEGRPLVRRVALEGAGPLAIAVGFPEGLHAAFDAISCRWRIAWRGRFLSANAGEGDAVGVLGEEVTGLSEVFPPPPGELRYLGYRLEQDGTPVFLYEADGLACEDSASPREGRLHRVLRVGGRVEEQRGGPALPR